MGSSTLGPLSNANTRRSRSLKRNHLQPKRRGKPHVPGMCEIKNEKIAKLSKRDRDKIKDECGIYAVRRLTPKKKVRFKPMKQKKKKRGKMASS